MPSSRKRARKGGPQQPTPGNSSGKQPAAATVPCPDDALDNPVLEELDEEHITYMESHIALKYNHDEFEGGSNLDRIAAHWLQAFGPSGRLAAGIEVPVVHFNGEEREPNTSEIGDSEVEFRGMLSKGEKFEQAAAIEFTLPTATNDLVGEDQTVLKLAWGFSAQIASHTLLSGEVGYNKAVHTGRAEPAINNIEPELILSQAFGKRFGVSVDWDSYYEFNVGEHVQTLKAELLIELDRKEKWSIAPYAAFPLSQASRAAEFNNSAGFDLISNF